LNLRRFGLVFVLLISHASAAREITDSSRVRVSIVDHPERIVTLAPSIAELVSDFLGIELQRIVGVTESTDFPPALKKVPSVGQYQKLNLEKIASLKPDLIIATKDGNSKDQIDHLRELGLPVLVLSTNSFSEVESSMKLVAEVLGPKSTLESRALIDRFEQAIATFRERGSKRVPRKRIMLELDDNPLIVVGGKSFLNEAASLIGTENIYSDSNTGYPRPSKEDVIMKNPDIILLPTFGAGFGLGNPEFIAKLEAWALYPTMKAVKTHQVKAFEGDTLLRPSMRLLDGLALLERAVYGAP
jgi:iron complex transport system substrate-binding protein